MLVHGVIFIQDNFNFGGFLFPLLIVMIIELALVIRRR